MEETHTQLWASQPVQLPLAVVPMYTNMADAGAKMSVPVEPALLLVLTTVPVAHSLFSCEGEDHESTGMHSVFSNWGWLRCTHHVEGTPKQR